MKSIIKRSKKSSQEEITIKAMKSQIVELQQKADEVLADLTNKGKTVSKEWIDLQKLIMTMTEKLHKAMYGHRSKIEKTVTVKDIRKAFYDAGSEAVSSKELIDAEVQNIKKNEKN